MKQIRIRQSYKGSIVGYVLYVNNRKIGLFTYCDDAINWGIRQLEINEEYENTGSSDKPRHIHSNPH